METNTASVTMGPRLLLVVVLLLVRSRFSAAERLRWKRPIHLGGAAQRPAERHVVEELLSGEASQRDAAQPRSRQQTVNAARPFAWEFPDHPVETAEPSPAEEFPLPEPSTRYSVRCGEGDVQIELYMDELGLTKRMQPEDLTLGGCPATEVDESSRVLIFKTPLHGCGSNLTVTRDSLIYAFTLVYNPQGLGDSITRSSSAVFGISCHYPRIVVTPSEMSSNGTNSVVPSWLSYNAVKVAEEQLYFSLRLMTDDWESRRPSNQYLLGDVLNIEASVLQHRHAPLRLFVDSCVASLEPDGTALPRYTFITNHGCLVDAQITGSSSQFLPRSQDDKLRFRLEAFRFLEQQRDSLIYITCQLKAIAASSPRGIEHKACSFKNGRWEMAGGDDRLCHCCQSTCGRRKSRHVAAVSAERRQERLTPVVLGPIDIQDFLEEYL